MATDAADGGTAPGGYVLAGEVALAAPAADVVAWLTNAERMERWMLGVDAVVPLDDDPLGVRVITSSGAYAGWTYRGSTTVPSPARVVRRYVLEDLRIKGVSQAADASGYDRLVTYELTPTADGGTHVACTVGTTIPGLTGTGARSAVKAEQRTLDRSLERLEAESAGRGRGLIGFFRGAGLAPSPL